jgi:Putative Tad-like Flp pilus-assembly
MSQRRWRGLARRLPGREPGDAERGSLTLMLLVMFVALVGLAGIVIDGGARLTAAENATSVAQEAARAGAGLVDRQAAYTSGRFVVDVPAAEAAAQEYLTAAGYTGTAGPGPTPNSITVTVTLTQPTSVLSIIGIKDFTVNGQATANLEAGVTGPGQ